MEMCSAHSLRYLCDIPHVQHDLTLSGCAVSCHLSVTEQKKVLIVMKAVSKKFLQQQVDGRASLKSRINKLKSIKATVELALASCDPFHKEVSDWYSRSASVGPVLVALH